MPHVTLGKWGKSLALRIPADLARTAGLCDGTEVDLELRDGAILIRPSEPRFSLAELFAGKTPQQWRAAYAGAFDWGPNLGREAVED